MLHACGRMPWSAGSKGEADQRKLADAMCALLKCAAGADPNSAGYAAKVSSQNRGTDYKDEQQLLLKTGVFSEYGWSDGAIDIASTLLHAPPCVTIAIQRASGNCRGIARNAPRICC